MDDKKNTIIQKECVENIINSMFDMVIVINQEGCITELNQATENLLEYKKEELINKSIDSILPMKEDINAITHLHKMIKKGHISNYYSVLKTKADLFIQVSCCASPVRDKNEKLLGTVLVARDIRERLNLDMKMIQMEKLTSLGELTAGIAHELHQPLNGIKIICQSIIRDINYDRIEEQDIVNNLNQAVKQVDKMSDIINQMRIFTRKEQDNRFEAININQLLSDTLKFTEQQLINHNIEIAKKFDDSLSEISGNPIKLEQVFLNLLSNARFAVEESKKEKKKIEIATYRNNKGIVIEIKDNGTGISKNIIAKIFEPFFTTRDPGKGTGLGLPISKKIIEEHNGRIEVESTENQCTSFKIFLPALEAK